jgi:hypothetical protein
MGQNVALPTDRGRETGCRERSVSPLLHYLLRLREDIARLALYGWQFLRGNKEPSSGHSALGLGLSGRRGGGTSGWKPQKSLTFGTFDGLGSR